MNKAFLKASGLVKNFTLHHHGSGQQVMHAVNGLDVQLDQGQTLGIVGESGCGKSTLARMLVGLEVPTQGTIEIDGQRMDTNQTASLRKRARFVQYVFQDSMSALNPRHTIATALESPMIHLHQMPYHDRKTLLLELMDAISLDHRLLERYPHELSGGQAQRIGIARALAAKPKLLVLDEPLSALDASVQAQILKLLIKLKAQFGLTYILISHNLAVVEAICDSVMVMYFGQVVEHAKTSDLFNQPKHPYTELLLRSILQPGDYHRKIEMINDELPDPFSPPTGCPFVNRCPISQDICRQTYPSLEIKSHDHYARCLIKD